ncbi:unnamed protein product [Paramecium octaurelia]|uniref:Uncharacterized protein n=1 Tax=Paramecium octaurelia TaxID=43137 RepID=A0A8S1SN16_PAROT|nr:unnamed protein product [Paramecium octaurelia]
MYKHQLLIEKDIEKKTMLQKKQRGIGESLFAQLRLYLEFHLCNQLLVTFINVAKLNFQKRQEHQYMEQVKKLCKKRCQINIAVQVGTQKQDKQDPLFLVRKKTQDYNLALKLPEKKELIYTNQGFTALLEKKVVKGKEQNTSYISLCQKNFVHKILQRTLKKIMNQVIFRKCLQKKSFETSTSTWNAYSQSLYDVSYYNPLAKEFTGTYLLIPPYKILILKWKKLFKSQV